MFSSGNSWYEFTPFLLIYEGMLSLMFWMVSVHGTTSVLGELWIMLTRKASDMKPNIMLIQLVSFVERNSLVSYHTVTGIELPVNSDNHPRSALPCCPFWEWRGFTGTFSLWAPNWFLYNKHMRKVTLFSKALDGIFAFFTLSLYHPALLFPNTCSIYPIP